MTRRDARKTALELVYGYGFHSDEAPADYYTFELDERELEDDDFARKLFLGLCENVCALDEKIKENAVGWKFERLAPMSLAIMRLAVYEIMYCKENPFNIVINEAIELAKLYDHDKAPKFINGVLNTIVEKEGLKSEK